MDTWSQVQNLLFASMMLSHLQFFDEICWVYFKFCNSLMKIRWIDFKFSSNLESPIIYFNYAERIYCSSRFASPVRPQSDDLCKTRIRTCRTVSFNILLWWSCQDHRLEDCQFFCRFLVAPIPSLPCSVVISPGGAAAASPGSGEFLPREFRYLLAFWFCWVFKQPHCLGPGKRGGQGG